MVSKNLVFFPLLLPPEQKNIWFQKQMFQNLIQLQEQVHKDINDDFKRNLEGHLV